MVARIVIVAVAAALVVVLGVRLADHEACDDARRDVFASITGKGRLKSDDIRTILDRCRGTDALLATAGALRTGGNEHQALHLAEVATEREPGSFAAWRALYALTTGAERENAAARAKELNPRWVPAAGRAPEAAADEGP